MEFIFLVVIFIVATVIQQLNKAKTGKGRTNPRVQRTIERLQAQQAANRQAQGQPTFQAPQSFPAPGSFGPPTQAPPSYQQQAPQPYQQQPYQQATYQPPSTWVPSYGPPPARPAPAHRPPQNHLPQPKNQVDQQVRDLMAAGNEVGAVRLLCDERDLNILEAQEYARSLVAPPTDQPDTDRSDADQPPTDRPDAGRSDADEEVRYVGSAAFAESVFDVGLADDDVWASGWTEPKDVDDRSDLDELWQTVRTNGRPS